MKRILLLSAVVFAGAGLLLGCGHHAKSGTHPPAPHVGGASATPGNAPTAPAVVPARAGTKAPASSRDPFPVTRKDAQKVTVTIPRRPQRIVSVTPTVTEILFAIGAGDRVVAVSDQCDYPPQVKKLPRVGGFFTPSAEKTLAARPDLVIGQRGNPPEFIATLRKAGIPVYTIEPSTLDGIMRDISTIGQITGTGEAAGKVVAGMQDRLSAIPNKYGLPREAKRPSAFIFSQVSPVWTAGSGTFQDDAIRAAGAHNAGTSVKGFAEFSTEALLAADPDYLIVSTMEGAPGMMKEQLLASSSLRRLSAVKKGHVITLDGDHIMRPGPRVVDAIEAMAQAFYPPRSGRPSSSATSSR